MRLLIGEAEIDAAIHRVAVHINQLGLPVTFVVILKGAICLIADLIRKLSIPFELTFVTASSYGMRGKTPGKLHISELQSLDLAGKDVIMLDDICDTGATLSGVCSAVKAFGPHSVKTLVLLNKISNASRAFQPDMVCFDIDDHFVVGYGLDFKEQYRGLRGIYVMEA